MIPFPLLYNLINNQSDEMITATKQQAMGYWKILEDFPPRDGEFLVVFQTEDGSYGYPEIWEFTAKNSWQPVFGDDASDSPVYYLDIPPPQ